MSNEYRDWLLDEVDDLRRAADELYKFIWKHCPEFREWLATNYMETIYGWDNITTED